MTEVKVKDVIKFINASKKIRDMECNNKTLYHMRVGLLGHNGPYLDFKYEDKTLKCTELEVVYNGECVLNPTKKETILIKEAIESRDQFLKEEQLEKKKQELIKIVEEI